MRFVKLFAVLAVVCASFGIGYGQSTPAHTLAEHDLSKTVHLWPNPAADVDYVNVTVEQVPAKKLNLKIHNILGTEVETEVEVVDEHHVRVKIKDLASGYYLLAVNNEEYKVKRVFKLLKK